MHKSFEYLSIAFLYCIAGQTVPLEDYTITINCEEPGESPTTELSLKLSPIDGLAQLIYTSKDRENPITMRIYPPGGSNSSSMVTIKSVSDGGFRKENRLQISAYMSEIYRVTNYESFSLDMTKGSDGQFTANLLRYSMGIDAFPESSQHDTVNFSGLRCTVKGL